MDKTKLAEFKRRTDNLSTGDYPQLARPLGDPTMQATIDRLASSGKRHKDSKKHKQPLTSSLLFNRLDFGAEPSEPSSERLPSGKKRSPSMSRSSGVKSRLPKDPATALAKVASRQARLAALAERDPEAATAARERDSWSRAIERASGVAVRDDPKLLKRALTRRRRQKEIGRERWAERQQRVQEDQQHRQAKRRENIQSRKEAKRQKKARK